MNLKLLGKIKTSIIHKIKSSVEKQNDKEKALLKKRNITNFIKAKMSNKLDVEANIRLDMGFGVELQNINNTRIAEELKPLTEVEQVNDLTKDFDEYKMKNQFLRHRKPGNEQNMRVEVDFSPLAGLHYYKKYQKSDSKSKVNFSRQNTSLFISE